MTNGDFPKLDIKLPQLKPGTVKLIVIAIVALVVLAGSFYQISTEEVGIILRFGKYVRTTEPGLHLKIPGIEELRKVAVERQKKLEFGFRTTSAGIQTQYAVTRETLEEAQMLTGDLNVAIVEWIVQYKIKDPYNYLFKLRDAEATFRFMNEAVVRKFVGDNSVDEVITIGRARIAIEAKEELQRLCDLYEIGIQVDQLIFQDVVPPEPVQPSFNEVNESVQEKETKINQAWSEYNQEIPKAEGEAKQMIQAAEGYATERVNNAQGDATRFKAIHREYVRAPLVTRKRLYLEAIAEILPKVKGKYFIDGKLQNVLPLLNLDKEVIK
ncbi:FtsH protease activity modulator HflK [Acidobacteriota bacterium]